jgi:hypothetical protein
MGMELIRLWGDRDEASVDQRVSPIEASDDEGQNVERALEVFCEMPPRSPLGGGSRSGCQWAEQAWRLDKPEALRAIYLTDPKSLKK